jgi:6-pyruvoyltetrahydropterin/6-carboxytetrahydropterin synthase
MYIIKVETDFSAAHNLRGYKGKCETLHGHNWKVEVEVSRDTLNAQGMVMDFKILKQKVHKVLSGVDHNYLNRYAYFKKNNPTSENIAQYLYGVLKPKIKDLSKVTVWESADACAMYYETKNSL